MVDIIPCLDKNKFGDVFIYLSEQYDKNEIAELQPNEMEILINACEKLEIFFVSSNISFDRNTFIILIKRLYPNGMMIGGDGEIVDYTNTPRKKIVFTFYDFTAILSFIVSIYLLYLSFIQFNQLTCNITGNNVVELSLEVKQQINQAIKSLSREEFTFLGYIYNIFTTFTNNVVSTQQQRIGNIVKTILSSSIPDFTQQVTSQCITNETGWTGFFEATARTFVSPEATSNCVMTMSQTLITGFLQQQQQQITILLTNLQTNSLQIQNLVVYGVRLGYASTAYLTYRIIQIKRAIENGNSNTLKGGKRKTKKIKRKSRKTKKIKKSKKRRS